MAFEEVCPDMIELIHKNYRKLVSLLVDVEEWGQVVIVNMLTRYARTQFADPNLGQPESEEVEEDGGEFYENSDEEEEDNHDEAAKPLYKMDPDHRLLLRSTKPLLQSRNASVVMATGQLYWHLAPRPEVQVVAKSLVRLLRSHNEVQAVVLNSIASMTIKSQGGAKMFQPYLRQFFVRGTDPSHIKILKLEILTNLANGSNISILLREFQSYITGADPACVAATIQAIGRCAATISEVTDTCLAGLVHLLSNKDPSVVAESVVEIKKLLQTQEAEHKDIIIQMAKLVDTVAVPSARAAIVWVVGEYCERIPLHAPDVLRKMAKSFCTEEVPVKLQIVNLSVKMYLTNPAQTKLISQYVFNLAKFDQNYDLRDRARFIKAILFPQGEPGKISKHAKKIFLAPKPPPTIESKFANRDEFQLGSLSHFINARAAEYQDLPSFPAVAPDPSVRTVEVPKPAENPWKKQDKTDKKIEKSKPGSSGQTRAKFYDSDEPGHRSGAKTESSSSSDSESDSSSSSDEESSDSEPEQVKQVTRPVKNKTTKVPTIKTTGKNVAKPSKPDTESETSSSDEDINTSKASKPGVKPSPKPTLSNLDLLLDLEDIPPSMPTPVLTPSLGGFLSPTSSAEQSSSASLGQPMYVSTIPMELLNKVTTGGVAVNYRFTRHPHLYAPRMVGIELTFYNHSTEDIPIIKLGSKSLPAGMSLHEFPALDNISPEQSRSATLGIDYNDTTQAAKLDLVIGNRPYTVSINCPTGEMMRPLNMSQMAFTQEQAKLSGMNEATGSVSLPSTACDAKSVTQRIYQAANVLQVPSGDTSQLLFAGKTVSGGILMLISLGLENMVVTVNTEKIVLGNMMVKETKTALEKQ